MIPVAMEMALHDLAIRQLLARLAQAADDRDEATYLACLAGTVRPAPSGGAAAVPAETYMRAAMTRLSRADWTQHKLVNPVIDIEPDRNRASARVDAVVDLAFTDPDGKQHRLRIGGRYEIGLTHQGGTWLIDRRWLHRLYVDGDAKGLAI